MYYSFNAPATGGPALRALPHQGNATPPNLAARACSRRSGLRGRPRSRPSSSPRCPERASGARRSRARTSRPPVLVTSFRPDPNYPQMVAGVAWIDSTETSTLAVSRPPGAGSGDGVAGSDGGSARAPDAAGGDVQQRVQAERLRAAGSPAAGTHTRRCATGWRRSCATATAGSTSAPGRGGPSVGSDVVYARQNLPLIVSDGQPQPESQRRARVGSHAGQRGPRMAIRGRGRRSRQPHLRRRPRSRPSARSPRSCATPGAVRAMELDINTYWPSFITYRPSGRDRGGQSAAEHGPLARSAT